MNPEPQALPQQSTAADTVLHDELVVLLDEGGNPSGVYPKRDVHTTETPLHLAFSCHVANDAGDILVTRRALTKATWPGVWTNSFCGHPAPGETPAEAVQRRAFQELGMEVAEITPILPDFRYRAVDASGVVENEICPVFTAVAVGSPQPSPDEVAEWAWVSPADLRASVAGAPFAWSPWLGWQLEAWPS
ncbi:isopentenyl-diphosphate Delta-isomerase [Frondihabitans sp. VKM Ac-2883]|uniref:isopentenyl-diphosphate Delta-isomerase n=1 Tax=Frondihabitans sp. VKM Ac-2883 TaxID=2783823 RepID=UPI00188A65E8|nr:isopentenyl-diphosphate Delta-isomerase [Frondihabitans sp. VKM Ac-2883]MBF4577115.1 isopentenyl-diphosphate Delta-isomerase [Frondihabitans sp. VKM Ac-2883]